MKNWAASNVMPMAAKTTAKASPLPSTVAWRASWAVRSSCGRPEPEKIGSFCPRTSGFKPSMVEMPVWMNSFG